MHTLQTAVLSVLTASLFAGTAASFRASAEASDQKLQIAELKALSALQPIDAHTYFLVTDPAITSMLQRWNLHVLDILVDDDKDPVRGKLVVQRQKAFAFVHSAPGHVALCTTFDPFTFRNPDFVQTTIANLNADFAHGAVAVKMWKNVGMELKDSPGRAGCGMATA